MSNTNYPQWVIQGGPTERYLYGVYGFLPSYPAAWTAMALFAAVGLVALIRTVWRTPRCWWMYLLPITCLLEALGYWLRIVNAEQLTMSTVIATIVLLLIPPIIGAVVDYEVMGWMLERANTKLFCLKPKWVAWFFLTGDILSFVIQCGAAGLLTSKDSAAQDTGSKIVLTGLVLQFLIFLFFAYSAIKLWKMPVFAVRRDPATGATQELVPHTKLIFVTLLTTVGLLLLRNVFRLYEYGYALSLKRSSKPKDAHEWAFYVFETLPVFACCLIWTVVHFGILIKEAEEKKRKDEAAAATGALSVPSPDGAGGLQMVAVPTKGTAAAADASSSSSSAAMSSSLAFAKSSKLQLAAPPIHPTTAAAVAVSASAAAASSPSSSPARGSGIGIGTTDVVVSVAEANAKATEPGEDEEPKAPSAV